MNFSHLKTNARQSNFDISDEIDAFRLAIAVLKAIFIYKEKS